jgi:hypothetical protein
VGAHTVEVVGERVGLGWVGTGGEPRVSFS